MNRGEMNMSTDYGQSESVLEFKRVEAEFRGLSVSDVEECLKCLVACGRNSFVKESAKIAMEIKNYPHFLKLEVLEIREKINNQKWKEL